MSLKNKIEYISPEILEIALKKERDEKSFYNELAKCVSNSTVQEFLISMADESDDHQREIKELLAGKEGKPDSWQKRKALRETIETHFQTDIFPPLEDASKIASEFEGIEKVLDFAIEKERVAAEFFQILGQFYNNFAAKTALVLLEKLEWEHVEKIESFKREFFENQGRIESDENHD